MEQKHQIAVPPGWAWHALPFHKSVPFKAINAKAHVHENMEAKAVLTPSATSWVKTYFRSSHGMSLRSWFLFFPLHL